MSATGEDLAVLSYKELQALAAKYRVPGNIKKQSLLQVLYAAKAGNLLEVSKLLSDLKKNRKKRIKKLKLQSEGEVQSNSTLQDSPELIVQQDPFLFSMQPQHQQQYPFQWVGAEEEVNTNKYDPLKCNLSYNDIKQLILSSSKDRNNNGSLLDEIIDLRTEAPTITNHTNTLVTQSEDSSARMSLLLKKMLQAPVGANLGEIASPVSNWPLDTYQIREQPSPDNSETMTAKSDINENDEIWQDNVTSVTGALPCVFSTDQSYNNNNINDNYNNNNGVLYKREHCLSFYKSPLDNIVESNSICYNSQSYQFEFAPQPDSQEHCRNWLASNSLEIPEPPDYGSRLMASAPETFQYPSPETTADVLDTSPTSGASNVNIMQSSGGSYCLNDQPYLSSATLLDPTNSIVPEIHFDPLRYYQTPPSSSIQPAETQDYYRDLGPFSTNNGENQQRQCSTNTENFMPPIYGVDLESAPYDSAYYQDPNTSVNLDVTDPLHQVQESSGLDVYMPPPTSVIQNEVPPPPPYSSAVLDPYWPQWSAASQTITAARTGGKTLENTLNLCSSNYIDYSKVNETSCVSVFSTTRAPVMTFRRGESSVPATQEPISGPGEQRQHNFVSNWLLYDNDANGKGFSRSVPLTTMNGLTNFSSIV
ncbi:uncharacterized protein LOC106655194 [Trichogramma pretiosum]|uniref:uncharacterized protein LOC106655194 n=1 Tax=Trichogramma pretiosum TaxID=7493 RepID=UPI0006C99E27|nr:uncharacterized protein LOC106655194 [Trichogramma pretiosum]XP_014230930.1 uncharacterized protein LOC106655194 [Trichogramma pretiosum]XP_014230931.1 uncharacterized protein LOC106655194 [Trichogramma pretiosum]